MKSWKRAYEEDGLTLRELARVTRVPRETIRRWLVTHGVKLRRRGPRGSVSQRLTAHDVAEIRRRLHAEKHRGAMATIARDVGVSRQTIWQIAHRKTWKDV